MIRTSLSAALGCTLLLACSSAPTNSSEDVAQLADELTDLPATVDESALDRTVNPCADFYQFACGGYMAKTQLSGDSDSQSRAFGATQGADYEALQEILAKAQGDRSNVENRKVADYDAACVGFNTGRKPGALAAALAPELARVHAASRRGGGTSAVLGRGLRAGMTAGAVYGYLSGGQSILSVYPAPDRDGDPNVIALHVEPTFNLETDPSSLSDVLDDNYPDLTPAERDDLANLVVRIDTALADALAPYADNQDYNPVGRAGFKAAMPHVDVDRLLAHMGTPDAKKIVLWNLKGLTAIDGVFATIGEADLDRYLDYKLVEAWWWADGALSLKTADAAAHYCLTETGSALAGIVEHRFVSTLLGRKNTKVAMAMAKAELATFAKRLETTPFLDDATRAEAIKKAQAMEITPLVEPRDRYRDVDVSAAGAAFVADQLGLRDHAVETQLAQIDRRPGANLDMASAFEYVNAFYDPTLNRFTILPGISHGTFFGGVKAPAAHNFGALGWVIGHEMTHGFDNDGRLYDEHGADRNWWTPAAEAAFNERAACFVDEYSGFAVDGVIDPGTGTTAHVNGAQTLGENIADNGGIRTAFQTATPYFAKGKPDAGFPPVQQFFVAAAQTWCEKKGPQAALSQLSYDVHSPGKARVNETLSNFDEFAKAFACTADDAMVAKPVCAIW